MPYYNMGGRTGERLNDDKPAEQPAKPASTVLTDEDPMPFGRAHKGKPMKDVPVDYLFWLWTQPGFADRPNNPVADYIRTNMKALQSEYPDGIW